MRVKGYKRKDGTKVKEHERGDRFISSLLYNTGKLVGGLYLAYNAIIYGGGYWVGFSIMVAYLAIEAVYNGINE